MDNNTDPMNGRWLRELTEKEIRWLTRNHTRDAVIVEWPWANQTYFLYERHSAIIRTGAAGGDTFDIHGGWKYASPLAARLDWTEIEHMGRHAIEHGGGMN